jgi:hypothetical protein
MSDDYAFFEYKAKITNSGHAENEGEPVHCMIKMKSLDEHGKRRRNVELEQQAGDGSGANLKSWLCGVNG